MRARRLAVIAACAAFALAGCSKEQEPAPGPAEAPAAVETTSEEPTQAPADAASYMDSGDHSAHLACIGWSELGASEGLSGENAVSTAGRALRADDDEMVALVSEAGIGPMVTDPWGMSQLCESHGYEADAGSLAEHYSA